MNEFEEQIKPASKSIKFLIGGMLIAAAIIYLIVSSVSASAQYFLTVEETLAMQRAGELDDRQVRISGAVLGDSIVYDQDSLTLGFTIAHVPAENQLLEEEGGLAAALHNAVSDPDRATIDVRYLGPIPDMLQHEAQAILTGQVNARGVFQAEEILLKCPTKYESSVPEQSGEN